MWPHLSIIHIRYYVIPPNIYLLYPYKILRYWYGMHKISTNYLSILYIMYSFFHLMKWNVLYSIVIRLCLLLFPSHPLYLYSPIYICSIFHTILCKYSAHLSPLSISLVLSILSIYLISNLSYLSLPLSPTQSSINITYIYLSPITYIPMNLYVLYLL